jgi:hypothetical protein
MKRKNGFSFCKLLVGLRSKRLAGYWWSTCTLPFGIPFRVYMKYNFGLDAMNNPRKSMPSDYYRIEETRNSLNNFLLTGKNAENLP